MKKYFIISLLILLAIGQQIVLASTASPNVFTDVTADSPYYEALKYLKEQGIVSGYEDGSFKPDQTVNRVEALKIILLGAKIDLPESSTVKLTFNDIKTGEWYIQYLSKAVELNIVGGYPDGTFKPTQTVNLVENLKMLVNTKNIDTTNIQVSANPYTDAVYTEWYAKYVQYAKDQNWLTPDSKNMIYPSQGMTRGKLAQLIYNSQNTNIKFEGHYIDVHIHITPSAMSLADTIKNMDTEGIDMAVIMKPPASIIDTPQSDSGIPDAAEQYPDRFIALYGGEAITMLEKAATSGSYTKADEEKYTALLETEIKSGKYRGFGEIGLRHLVPAGDKHSAAYDLTIPGNHPWMFIMSDIAAKYDVPIDIHMEATDETVSGLESLLDHNKNTKIIWDHASWSSTDQATPQLISQLMGKHPNLYSSIKIREENSSSAVYIFDDNGEITSEWMALLKKYPDRFMIGSDIKPGRKANEFSIIKTHRDFLEQLPPEILKPIERDNAKEIFKID
jgi:predicted DNA-binding antitoxin AbrB/MazE fold protein/predicted urease superfamily metal-dependent hydrolase